nr:MAG TPA: hypothetical protein [Bacteriophage sp.]
MFKIIVLLLRCKDKTIILYTQVFCKLFFLFFLINVKV